MKTAHDRAAANLLNFLALLTVIAPSVSVDEMTHNDALDAIDTADFWFLADAGVKTHLPDGRVLLHF